MAKNELRMPHLPTDIHTHRRGRPDAVLSLEAPDALALHASVDAQPFSLALHPWHLTAGGVAAFETAAERCAGDARLRAIGECGLDPAGPCDMAAQRAAFETALRTALCLGLPTVVHCVRWWDTMQQAVRAVWGSEGARAAEATGCPIVVHGFRKGPELAAQLLRQGFSISLGEHFNPNVPAIVPSGKLFSETDESALPIAQIRKNIYLCGGNIQEIH